jgi:glucosamine--fructose-6-phosphate aminotransferase (isomerizing)
MISKTYPHHMLKEIFEEPEALRRTIELEKENIREIASQVNSEDYEIIYITGSGTSYHAGLASQYALSNLTGLMATALPASEFNRWIPPEISRKTLLMAISQSGESTDVLQATDAASRRGISLLAVTNTLGSTLAKKADYHIFPRSGRELAIPATKTYVTQLLSIFMFSVDLASEKRGDDSFAEAREGLYRAPGALDETLRSLKTQIREAAERFKDKQAVFLLGSGPNYATALEGALKLKETCIVFAEGFATREFFHGPMRLADERTLMFILASADEAEEAVRLGNSLRGFGASVIYISERSGEAERLVENSDETFLVPSGLQRVFSPILYVLPLQLFSYYMCLAKGLNPDKPEKLRKVVR